MTHSNAEPDAVSQSMRMSILQEQLPQYIADGWHIELTTDYSAVISKRSESILAATSCLALGVVAIIVVGFVSIFLFVDTHPAVGLITFIVVASVLVTGMAAQIRNSENRKKMVFVDEHGALHLQDTSD